MGKRGWIWIWALAVALAILSPSLAQSASPKGNEGHIIFTASPANLGGMSVSEAEETVSQLYLRTSAIGTGHPKNLWLKSRVYGSSLKANHDGITLTFQKYPFLGKVSDQPLQNLTCTFDSISEPYVRDFGGLAKSERFGITFGLGCDCILTFAASDDAIQFAKALYVLKHQGPSSADQASAGQGAAGVDFASGSSSGQPKTYGGVYGLQSAMDFDSLDGASYDPSTGVLSLFGHRARPGRPQQIDYLDHLAAALESDSPIFSLEWTPSSERAVDRALESRFTNASSKDITERLGTIFDSNGRLNANGAWLFKALGVDVTEGMNRYEVNGKGLEAVGRSKAGRVLAAFGTFALAKERNDEQAGMQGLTDMLRNLGMYDDVVERNRKWRNNEITRTKRDDLNWSEMFETLGSTFGWESHGYASKYESLRQSGRSSDEAFDRVIMDFQNDLKVIPGQIMDALEGRASEILVPSPIMTKLIGVEPRVRPVFTRLPARSQLARVALEADVFCKSLMDRPDLKQSVPTYRTYFEWLRGRNEHPVTGEGHLWISQDNFEIFESMDGRALRFGRTPMRFYIERYTAGHKSTPDPQLTEYASLLTRCYNDIADQNPTLYELRECTKVVAVAQWLKRRGAKIALPSEGRTYWNPPSELPGVIYMTMAVKAGPSGAILNAAGGVDFAGDGGWRYAPGPVDVQGQDFVEQTIQQTKEKVEQMFHGKLDVPSPQPLGWVGTATVDGHPVSTVGVSTTAIDTIAGSGVQLQSSREDRTALLWKSGDLEGAEKAYRNLVETCSGDAGYCASLRMLHAEVLHEKGDDRQAVQELNEAARMAPGLPLTQLLLAKELNASGDLQGAREAVQRYLSADPGNQAASKILGDLERRQSQGNAAGTGQSATHFRDAIAGASNNIPPSAPDQQKAEATTAANPPSRQPQPTTMQTKPAAQGSSQAGTSPNDQELLRLRQQADASRAAASAPTLEDASDKARTGFDTATSPVVDLRPSANDRSAPAAPNASTGNGGSRTGAANTAATLSRPPAPSGREASQNTSSPSSRMPTSVPEPMTTPTTPRDLSVEEFLFPASPAQIPQDDVRDFLFPGQAVKSPFPKNPGRPLVNPLRTEADLKAELKRWDDWAVQKMIHVTDVYQGIAGDELAKGAIQQYAPDLLGRYGTDAAFRQDLKLRLSMAAQRAAIDYYKGIADAHKSAILSYEAGIENLQSKDVLMIGVPLEEQFAKHPELRPLVQSIKDRAAATEADMIQMAERSGNRKLDEEERLVFEIVRGQSLPH